MHSWRAPGAVTWKLCTLPAGSTPVPRSWLKGKKGSEQFVAFLVDRQMPTACDDCPCMYDYIQCTALKDNAKDSLSAVDDYTVRQTWCPIKEIVLCKDCIHQDGKDGQCPVQNTGDPFYDSKPDDDWFCADGEKAEKSDHERS